MRSKFHRVVFTSWSGAVRSLAALFFGWSALGLLLGAACSGTSDRAALTVEEFCLRSAEVLCEHLAGCCSVSAADCMARQRAGCEESASNATTRGMAFDGFAAERCVNLAESAYEDCIVPVLEGGERSDACSVVFTGSRPPGASCTFDGACRADAGQSGLCADSVCAQVPTLNAGAPCGARGDGVCAAGHYCDGACQPLLSLGDSCKAPNECASGRCDGRACVALPLAEICASLTEADGP